MDKRDFKDGVYEQLARVGKAMSNPKRVELLDLLTQGERTVESLAGETGLSIANASQHLQVLRAAQLVDSRKEGLFVHYRAADPAVGVFISALRTLAEGQLAELAVLVAKFQAGQDEIESIDGATLVKRLRAGNIVLLDTRPENEYAAGHIPGAINIPIDALPRNLRRLPKDQEIVAYCRGPYCLYATEAVQLLQRKGYQALRLRDGVSDWRALGKRVSTARRQSFRDR